MDPVQNIYELVEDFECICDDFLCMDLESINTQSEYEAKLQKKGERYY